MNKLKEQFRKKLLGQLSDEKTELDINNAVDVCKDFTLSFIYFLRENYTTQERYEKCTLDADKWREWGTSDEYTIEELYNKFLEHYNGQD